jgi:hypothetical protein
MSEPVRVRHSAAQVTQTLSTMVTLALQEATDRQIYWPTYCLTPCRLVVRALVCQPSGQGFYYWHVTFRDSYHKVEPYHCAATYHVFCELHALVLDCQALGPTIKERNP